MKKHDNFVEACLRCEAIEKANEEARLQKMRDCPHPVEEVNLSITERPTAMGMEVVKYWCMCKLCGFSQTIEADELHGKLR